MQGQCWGQCQGKPAWEPVIWKNRRTADQTKVKLNLFPFWSFCLTSWVQCKVCVWFASLWVFSCWIPKRNSYLLWTTSPPLMLLLLQNWWNRQCSNLCLFMWQQTCGPVMFWAQTRLLGVWTFSCFTLKCVVWMQNSCGLFKLCVNMSVLVPRSSHRLTGNRHIYMNIMKLSNDIIWHDSDMIFL